MRVLIVNNFVRLGSGIDGVVALERECLDRRSVEYDVYARDNNEFDRADPVRRAALLAGCVYSLSVRTELDQLLTQTHFDVVHVHNTVPQMGAALWDALRGHGVPAVMHLHNYRAFCLSSYAYRAGAPCSACDSTAFLACASYACYRDSFLASSLLVSSRWVDWARGRRSGTAADAFVACSRSVRDAHVAHGIPEDRIRVLYNSANDLAAVAEGGRPCLPPCSPPRLTFVGSVIREKGVYSLVDLAAALPEFEVHVIGSGRQEWELKQQVSRRRLANVTLHGLLHGADMVRVWAPSLLTVLPSLWQEPFPLVGPESLSLGVPVLTTGAGGLKEAIIDGETGFLVDFEDMADVAARVRALHNDPIRSAAMRQAARRSYELRFTADRFADGLIDIFATVAREPRSAPRLASPRAAHRAPVRPVPRMVSASPPLTLVDGHLLGSGETSSEAYVRGLLSGLQNIGACQAVAVERANVDVGEHLALHLNTTSAARRVIWELPRLIAQTGASVLHCACHITPYTKVARVVTIHDLSFLHHPEMFTVLDRAMLTAGAHLAARHADRICVPSQFTRNDVADTLGVDLARIAVTPGAAEERFSPQTPEATAEVLRAVGIDRPYVLTPDDLRPSRSLGRLLEAWSLLESEGLRGDHVLVMAGRHQGRRGDIERLCAALGIRDWVLVLGCVDDALLPGLIGGADAFVYPSLFDGFGLPVVEAMACGTPVACSDIMALREVCQDAAAFFDPYDRVSIAATLSLLLEDDRLRADLAGRGRRRATELSWEECARVTLAAYREAAQERAARR